MLKAPAKEACDDMCRGIDLCCVAFAHLVSAKSEHWSDILMLFEELPEACARFMAILQS
jgi:hypothetical protein